MTNYIIDYSVWWNEEYARDLYFIRDDSNALTRTGSRLYT